MTKYLGFPFGVNIPQKDIDAAILLNIRTKMAVYTGRRLSLPARVLVSNQVILASIWYLASCSHPDNSVFMKVRTIIRNFIWSGSADGKPRAKVAWDTAVIPTIKGGIKIFDPLAQSQALLAKMIPRAMSPGPEPWKSLVRHRISRLAFRKDGDWFPSDLWLCSASRIKP